MPKAINEQLKDDLIDAIEMEKKANIERINANDGVKIKQDELREEKQLAYKKTKKWRMAKAYTKLCKGRLSGLNSRLRSYTKRNIGKVFDKLTEMPEKKED